MAIRISRGRRDDITVGPLLNPPPFAELLTGEESGARGSNHLDASPPPFAEMLTREESDGGESDARGSDHLDDAAGARDGTSAWSTSPRPVNGPSWSRSSAARASCSAPRTPS